MLLDPNFGEIIVVFGLGLVGLLTIQLLKLNGCSVIGVDIDSSKCELGKSLGIEVINAKNILNLSEYINQKYVKGVDGVIITVSSPDNKIIKDSATICRKEDV